KLKKYDELYVLADELIAGPRLTGKDAQVYYVVANASFERQDFPRTTEYFAQYTKNRGRMQRTDHFRYAYSHYKQQQFAEAIPIFQRVLSKNDSLEQVASYYLGFCYLKQNDEPNAKVAFQKASQDVPNANTEIQQDALYQYAKVSFATQSYEDALTALTSLAEKYPNAAYISEVQAMIGETYLYTRDYPRSIKYFESIPRTSPRIREAYQTVLYFYGLEVFERPDYRRSILAFNKAIQNNYNKDMATSAKFWLAESQFRSGDFEKAKSSYQSYLRTNGVSRNEFYARGYYGKAWSDFKLKNYPAALGGFEEFISKGGRTEDKNLIVDANLRSGDCLFLQRNYPKARTYYNRVLDFRYTFRDYASYQIAESFYRQNQYQSSVSTFSNLINNFRTSELRDNALDRISEIYLTWIGNASQATKYAKQLVQDYPRSPLAAAAYNRLAIAAFSADDANGAIRYFKKVLADYPFDKENAQIALENLGQLLEPADFDKVFKEYRAKNPDMNNNLAALAFTTGKDRFFSANYASAVEQFSTYIREFKNGPDYFEALLFRARSYRELRQVNKSLTDYKSIYSTTSTNAFTNVALLEAAEIKFEQKDFLSSLELYQQLENVAGKLANRVQAKFGIAKNYKAMKDYQLAQDALTQIENNNEVAVYSRTQAKVEIGNLLYLRGLLDQALQRFQTIERDFKNEFGAESQHMITQILYDQGAKLKNAGQSVDANAKFEDTKNAGIYLKNTYPTFNYWKAKSFLIVAEANYQLGEVFQAKGVLESLVGEDRFPEIQQQAQKRLTEIQAEEDAQNALPPVDGNN
ncbi:MAG: tetratricopeptide repeat protein, partial [Bacteroidota bacterium]